MNDRDIVEIHLSGENCHNAPQGRISMQTLEMDYKGAPILMDRAYEGDKTRELALFYGHEPVVPPKKTRTEPWDYDKELYKQRNIIERLFRWLKSFRRVFTCYDKTDKMYLSFLQFAFIFQWTK